MKPRCHLCGVIVRPAFTVINKVPLCREHAREVVALPLDLKIAPVGTDVQRMAVRV